MHGVATRLEDPLIEGDLAVEEAGAEGVEGAAGPGEGIDLVEQAALLVVGAARDTEMDRQPQPLDRIVEGPNRLSTALCVAAHRRAADLHQQVGDLGVVVEDGGGGDPGALGDVLDAQPDGAALEQHPASGLGELAAACILAARSH